MYSAEITAAEITVIHLDLYGEHRPEERIRGSKTITFEDENEDTVLKE